MFSSAVPASSAAQIKDEHGKAIKRTVVLTRVNPEMAIGLKVIDDDEQLMVQGRLRIGWKRLLPVEDRLASAKSVCCSESLSEFLTPGSPVHRIDDRGRSRVA